MVVVVKEKNQFYYRILSVLSEEDIKLMLNYVRLINAWEKDLFVIGAYTELAMIDSLSYWVGRKGWVIKKELAEELIKIGIMKLENEI